MIWSAVCSVAPHSQLQDEARPYLCIDEQKRPTPERRPLRLTQDTLVKPIPKGLVLTLGMKAWTADILFRAGVGKLFVRRATFEKNVAAEGRTLSLQNRKVYSLCKKNIFILNRVFVLHTRVPWGGMHPS